MRRLLPAMLLSFVGCVPSFEAVPCYGAGECPAPAICVHRRCLQPPRDMAIDAVIPDAGVQDRVETIAEFGDDGRVTLPITGEVTTVRALADGGLLIGGQRGSAGTFVAKLTAKGGLDAEFARDGLFEQQVGESDQLGDLAVDADGQIIMLGTWTDQRRSTLTVQRLSPRGQLDLTFGETGTTQARDVIFAGSDSAGARLVVTPSGRVQVAGISHYRFANNQLAWTLLVLQLDSQGQLSPAYGDMGRRAQPRSTEVRILPAFAAIDASGALRVAGACGGDVLCSARVLADGTFDRTYGVDGVAAAVVPDERRRANITDGLVDGDGLIAAVHQRTDDGQFAALTRLEPDGDQDLRFGVDGWASLGAPIRSSWPTVQAHCGAVELAVDDGRVLRFDAGGQRTHMFDALPLLPSETSRTFGLGDGGWMTVGAIDGGLVLQRFETTCLRESLDQGGN